MHDIVRDLYNDQFGNIMMNMKNYLMPNTSLETSGLKIIKINNFFGKKIQKLIKNKNQKTKH